MASYSQSIEIDTASMFGTSIWWSHVFGGPASTSTHSHTIYF